MTETWRPHYSRDQLLEAIDRFSFPERFLFGTSTSGYQSEGGFNGPDEPKNNWYHVEADGSMETTGPGPRFWELYPEDLERASLLGCNGFRMGIEWSRVQPEADPACRKPPPFDASALDRYAEILAGCRRLGMEPAVTLFHFTHPLWLGIDPWLDRDGVMDPFVRYVEHTVRELNVRLVNVHGTAPVSYWITVNEPAMVPQASYLLKVHPRGKGRGGRRDFAAAFENMLLAHTAAYRQIHRLYEEEGWPRPTVTVNGWASAVYPMDFLVLDILHAPAKGVERPALPGYLAERRRDFLGRMDGSPCRVRQNRRQRWMEKAAGRIMDSGLGKVPLASLTDRVFSEPSCSPWMDVLAFDYYDPFIGDHLETRSLFRYHLRKDPWEWGLVPEGLGGFLDAYANLAEGMPLHIVENGMAYACREGRAEQRPDGAGRVEVLKAHLYECLQARNRGRPLEAYFYWTLFDNYEWGSFAPRFGMLGVDYERGGRRSPLDAAGNNAAGAYRAILEAFRARDKDALKEAFCAESYPLLFPED